MSSLNVCYTLGYILIEPAELLRLATELNAVVVDVRLSPRSRNPEWNGGRVAALLPPGRYRHEPRLGNLNYKGGPIKIRDLRAGTTTVLSILARQRAILLCVCADGETCHRAVIAKHLRTVHGVTVEEIDVVDDPDEEET